MKQAILLSAMGVLASAGTAAGAEEIGRVISSTPVIQQVAVPRQVCNTQPVMQQPSSGGGAVVGAIVGGLLGNAIGHGTGRAVATGAGIVAGAAVGDTIETRGQPQAVQQCTTQTFYENRTVGYNVLYEYAGKQYTVQMPYDPGQTIRLQLSPIGSNAGAPDIARAAPNPSETPAVVSGPPVGYIVGEPATNAYPAYGAYPAYPAYSAPVYYGSAWRAPYYYAPIGLALSIGYSSGWRHHGHRHWR